jgi:hypothetical protein
VAFSEVVIVGGGASGLMCAYNAAQRGRKVVVLDRSNRVGKKILMSGGGKCNFTNLDVQPENFICNNPHFVKSALKRYTQWDFLGMVLEHGIAYEERKHGQLFCLDSAKDILNMLLALCEQAGVKIITRCEINAIKALSPGDGQGARYQLSSNHGQWRCQSLVIASGALSIPTMGSSGFGYQVAEQFGLPVLPRRAGLVPFTFTGELKALTERLSGLALDVTVCTTGDNATCFRENLLFTHRGMSGPVVLQVSNYWQPGEAVAINLLPDVDLHSWLIEQKQQQPKALLRTQLTKWLAKSLVAELQQLHWPKQAEQTLANFSDRELEAIADAIHHWRVKPSGTEGYRTAEVTLGGVDTDALSSKTLECKQQPGLFFIGEVVDVTGHLGGYNFQWAWSSGFAAAQYV